MLVCKYCFEYEGRIQEGDPMKGDVIRLSFDICVHEHARLKAACAEAMTLMKDF